jgi:predicted phosphodiesterase
MRQSNRKNGACALGVKDEDRPQRDNVNEAAMRIFALSDIHIDYEVNARWVANVSAADYRDDVLILAGDVTDTLRHLEWCLRTLAARFRKVLFVPGNHDLWVVREGRGKSSLQKFNEILEVTEQSGASMQVFHHRDVSIVPLLGWYDYSFGEPRAELRAQWMDYHACRWPDGFREWEITAYFTGMNVDRSEGLLKKVITFSHFLPRIDLMPAFIPRERRFMYPVLGTTRLEQQLRMLNASIHVYGHSHVNRRTSIEGVSYINNAFGYPSETWISSKQFSCIHEC